MSQIDSRESVEYSFSKHVLYRAEAKTKYRREQNKLVRQQKDRDKKARQSFMVLYSGHLFELVYALSEISYKPIKQDKTDRDLLTLYQHYKDYGHNPWALFATESGFLIKNGFLAIDHGFAFIDPKENSICISDSGLLLINEAYLYMEKKDMEWVEYIKNREARYGGHEILFRIVRHIRSQSFQPCDVTLHLRSAMQVFKVHGKLPPTIKGEIDGVEIYAMFRAIDYGLAELDEVNNKIFITQRGSAFASAVDGFYEPI